EVMSIGAAFSAVVLAGGGAARPGGGDKGPLAPHGRTLLTGALDAVGHARGVLAGAREAVADAAEVVVVGDPVPTHRPVTFTREDPRHGGPVAALLPGGDGLLDPRAWVAARGC